MIPSFWRQTITRVRPGSKTLRGSTVPDWDNSVRLDIPHCSVQPVGTSLIQDGRIAGIMDGLTVYGPPDADVQAGDRIEYGGKVYTINGEVLSWPSATGGLDHIQLNLERWQG